jgi:hypothetical protein
MPYKMTYVELDLLTCTFSSAVSEIITCDITEKLVTEYDSELCTIGTAWEALDTDCCLGLGVTSPYTGTGDDPYVPNDAEFIAEYSTYNFATCEVTDTTCEYVDWCYHELTSCEYWANGTPWADTLYVVNMGYKGGGGVGWDWGNSYIRQFDPVPVVFDETLYNPGVSAVWKGNLYFNDAVDGPICISSTFTLTNGSCGDVATRATDTTGGLCTNNILYPSCTGAYSGLVDPQNNDMGATVRVHPHPVYLEYWEILSAALREVTVKIMDSEGLSAPPPGVTSCPKVQLPPSLTVTRVGGVGGVHTMTYSQGMYRGTRSVLALLASEVPGGVAASNITVAVWHHVDATGDIDDAIAWTVADKVSCVPILFTNVTGTLSA